jgi:hypothetical protein
VPPDARRLTEDAAKGAVVKVTTASGKYSERNWILNKNVMDVSIPCRFTCSQAIQYL